MVLEAVVILTYSALDVRMLCENTKTSENRLSPTWTRSRRSLAHAFAFAAFKCGGGVAREAAAADELRAEDASMLEQDREPLYVTQVYR